MSKRIKHTNHAKNHPKSQAKSTTRSPAKSSGKSSAKIQPKSSANSPAKNPAKQKTLPKERGALLTALLALVIVNGAILTMASWSDKNAQGEVTMPIILGLFILSSIAHVVAGVALWYWKRWGLALYAASALLTGVLGIINTGSLIVLMGAVVPFAVVGYVVRMKWRMFE